MTRRRDDIKTANGIIGGLSQTDKMPGLSWGIPSDQCKTGARLAKVSGNVCHDCYTKRGRYQFGTTKTAFNRRLMAWRAGRRNWRAWADAFAAVVDASDKVGYFRWFDSGDLQDIDMLRAIVRVAELLPGRRFWLPTQEHKLILRFIEDGGTVPENLTIRLSSREVDGPRPAIAAALGLPTSGTSRQPEKWTCKAHEQGNRCLACRACWDPAVSHVVYPHKGKGKEK